MEQLSLHNNYIQQYIAQAQAKNHGAFKDLPIKVLQFGEGNFLRAFIDWMIYKANTQNLFNGRVLALQCTPQGKTVAKLQAQDCLYTTILHGFNQGQYEEQCELINSIAKALNPYTSWEEVLRLSMSKDIKFVFSNTTEAGLVYTNEQAFNTDICPQSFPGKLTQILYERYKCLGDDPQYALYILPCELIENNGNLLKDIVLKHIEAQNLPQAFKHYVTTHCRFFNTLVDRVVSGYPQDKHEYYEEKLNYQDNLMAQGELFHFMAIEGDESLEHMLPFNQANLNVVIKKDISDYRLRKVRILNGTHTANVPYAYLYGLNTVDELMHHKVLGQFTRSLVLDEIIPCTKLDSNELITFAHETFERFLDSSMQHKLESILMNSTSKVKSRLIPIVLDARAKSYLPKKLCFALASYIALYRHIDDDFNLKVLRENNSMGTFQDDKYALEVMKKAWQVYQKTEASALFTVQAIFSDNKLWDSDLSKDIDLMALIAKLLHAICSDGVINTIEDLMFNN